MKRWNNLEALERREPETWDLERIPDRRDRLETLRERLDLLDTEERVLLKTYLETGSSFDAIARLTGMNRSTVCRRIHRLLRRLSDETYARCEADRAAFGVAGTGRYPGPLCARPLSPAHLPGPQSGLLPCPCDRRRRPAASPAGRR